MLTDIEQELKRREDLYGIVDKILLELVIPRIQKRMKRSEAQGIVCEKLGLIESNITRGLVTKRMAFLGFPECVVEGIYFYKNPKWKKEVHPPTSVYQYIGK